MTRPILINISSEAAEKMVFARKLAETRSAWLALQLFQQIDREMMSLSPAPTHPPDDPGDITP